MSAIAEKESPGSTRDGRAISPEANERAMDEKSSRGPHRDGCAVNGTTNKELKRTFASRPSQALQQGGTERRASKRGVVL